MKKAYNVLLSILCVVVALSFLPWIYGIAFPYESSDPFVAFSPVSGNFVVSLASDGDTEICTVDADGKPLATGLSKDDRDSLIPQMYFNQLSAKGALPDSVGGKHIDIPTLKNSQWVFNSVPRDINRVPSRVYPIMESRPKRLDLEDPTEVFMLDGGHVRFIDMETNSVNVQRSARFDQVIADRGFVYPVTSANADITAKKPYDEGYLLADAVGKVYHLKMQAGQPYMASVNMPEGAVGRHVFILENPDTRHIGLVTTDDGSLYAIERDGYRAVRLPVDDIYPERQRVTIFKNLFNWVIKVSDKSGSRWTAIDSDDYSLLGQYIRPKTSGESTISKWIFPFIITFTDIDDCYAYPRISGFSARAIILWAVIAAVICLTVMRKPKKITYKTKK